MTDPADPRTVRAVYDDIATHFSKTRASPWPEVSAYLESVRGRRGLDLGCGNGRHLAVLTKRVEEAVGIDASPVLLTEAAKAAPTAQLVVGDAMRIPLAAATVDVGLYIATIHHLPDRDRRRQSLAELKRVLQPGGTGLVSAWSTAHDRFDRDDGFDTTIDWTLPDGRTRPRFYHIYDRAEFRADIAASPLTAEKIWVSSGNCYARVRRE